MFNDKVDDLLKLVKPHLKDYLVSKGIRVDGKGMPCINPAHVHNDYSKVMSYDSDNNVLRCFGRCAQQAGKKSEAFDLLDVIEWEEGITDFHDKLRFACEFCGVDYSGVLGSRKKETGHLSFIGNKFLEESGLLSSVDGNGNTLKDLTKMINAALINFDKAEDYLASRSISRSLAKKHFVGYLHDHDIRGEKYDVLVLPSDKYHLTLRKINKNDEARYENRGPSALYNSSAIFEACKSGRPVFIVEGALDVLSIETAGGLAVGLNSVQNVNLLYPVLEKVSEVTGKKPVIIVACDNDEPGYDANVSLLEKLTGLKYEVYWFDLFNGNKDANAALMADASRFTTLIGDLQTEDGRKRAVFLRRNNMVTTVDSIGTAETAVVKIPSGIPAVDNGLGGGIQTGLYVIGAMSGMGKTTLAMQIADNLASVGHHVMYISLEMSSRDLACRSVSKYMFLTAKASSAQEVRYCMDTDQVSQYIFDKDNNDIRRKLFLSAKQQYSNIANFLCVKDARAGIEQIEAWVDEYKKVVGVSPIVFIDYLQQLQSNGTLKRSDKQDVDSDISRLKSLSMNHDIPVIVLSSLNRLAYFKPITVDAFKESGSIEYSADFLIGLQLAGIGENGFVFDLAMSKYPREEEFVILKQRSRACYKKVLLDYYTKYNYFRGLPEKGQQDEIEPAADLACSNLQEDKNKKAAVIQEAIL